MKWKQKDAVTWQRKALVGGCSWQISFLELNGVYSVCLFNNNGSNSHGAFDELLSAKNYCAEAEKTHPVLLSNLR